MLRGSSRVAGVSCRAVVVAVALAVACGGGEEALRRAVVVAAAGQEREAIRILREHLAAEPGAIRERRLLIRLYGAVGDLGEAAAEGERLAEQLPAGSPVPWIELGHAHELSHRYDEALALYDRAGEVAPADPAGPRRGGMRAARWGELELAAPRLEEALRRAPRDAPAWHALGLVRLHLGDPRGAEAAYRSGLEADAGSHENRVGLATLALRRGDAAGALSFYDDLIAHRPRFPDAHLGRAWALLLLGRLDEAERAIERGSTLGGAPDVVRAQRARLAALRGAPPRR